jgi:uncharacterized protein (DUF305 family)
MSRRLSYPFGHQEPIIMRRSSPSSVAASALAAIAMLLMSAMSACGGAIQQSGGPSQSGAAAGAALTPAQQAAADHGHPPYTRADVHFMQGMIHHHAQAVVMAGWAPTHGASEDVRVLCERIAVAQTDEIAFMQRWLRERGETAPDPLGHGMPGHDMAGHDMSSMPGRSMAGMAMTDLMPGMLTPDQMKQLDAARGSEFDKLFLKFMIQHHQGALTMVDELFASPGAGQDGYVFRFASDVTADQSTEIDRMSKMLDARK